MLDCLAKFSNGWKPGFAARLFKKLLLIIVRTTIK